ncbi:MAG: polyphosphate kinase 1 [Odoribacter sp.]|nr:polyphosphate kinase 1 [Odoribacter sp.]
MVSSSYAQENQKYAFLRDSVVYHAVKMASTSTHSTKYALIQIPVNKSCPRFVQLPSEKGKFDVIFIDDIIRLCLDEIFFMFKYNLISAYSFTILRDSEFTIDDDISKSLMEKIELGLEGRYHSEIVRLMYDKNMPNDLLQLITSKLKLKLQQIVGGGCYHKMRDLMKFPDVRPDLENINPTPLRHPYIKQFSSILEVIRRKDIFLNYPYHTFNHLVDFLREAAIDPKVKSIYITLYRTAERSKVINTLINAVKNGKEVIVLEELMARFDEEQNVENSDMLQKAGVKVIHGFKGLKVHSKVVLVERKEKQGDRGYVYVGTGNFNESTAKIYGDFGLFTAVPEVAEDARAFFDFLINSHKHHLYKCLLVSPYFMRRKTETFIEREIKNKQRGKKAYIYAKFNSLTDIKMIKLLYKASQAGVEIRLIIRGACCLQPEVKGMSENIKVISIVDKYLEHARMVIFHNDGDEQIFIQSVDWMTRNLDHRVEVGIPIMDKEIKNTLKDIFNIQWSDNVKARTLKEPGVNKYVRRNNSEICRSQTALYEYYKKCFNFKV